jgi:hypothetical protein
LLCFYPAAFCWPDEADALQVFAPEGKKTMAISSHPFGVDFVSRAFVGRRKCPFGGRSKPVDFRKCLKLKINMLMKSTGQSLCLLLCPKKPGTAQDL